MSVQSLLSLEYWIRLRSLSYVGQVTRPTALNMASRSRGSLRPSFANSFAPKERAQGRPGARCTRGLVCNVHLKKSAHEHTGSAETLRPSLRDGFTAYFVLSPVTGLCCHRRSQEALASWKLDTSVGVSGPHDFAVRNNIARPQARSSRRYHRVHRIPRPTSVTIAIRPSCGRGMEQAGSADLPDGVSEIFMRRELDAFA